VGILRIAGMPPEGGHHNGFDGRVLRHFCDTIARTFEN
jgi:hypothetical protein